jgi:hypothetical protein
MGRTCLIGYNASNPYSCNCSGGNAYNCNCSTNYYSCNCTTNVSGYNAVYVAPSYYAGYTYSCNCQTCYPIYIRVIQSAASVISTITTWTLTALAQSLRIKTNSNQITVQAFSDDSLVTQIGSDLVYTGSGVVVTSNYGIVVYPSSTSQGTTLGTVEINKN